MIRSILFTGFLCGSAACSQQPQATAPPAAEPRVVVAPVPKPTAPEPVQAPGANTPGSPGLAVAFEYPADLGGRTVEKALTPAAPPLPPAERFGTTPRPRTVANRLLHPELIAKAQYTPTPILPAKPNEVKLAPPPERVPAELGRGADDVPAKPKLPVAPGITERARDVNLPPAMPTLGRPASDRVSLDDPTTEFGNAAIVAPAVKVPLAPAGFLRVNLPDPFELGAQVKPKLPPGVEPGLTPVPVNPQRVK